MERELGEEEVFFIEKLRARLETVAAAGLAADSLVG
jgi:hypothetical protein